MSNFPVRARIIQPLMVKANDSTSITTFSICGTIFPELCFILKFAKVRPNGQFTVSFLLRDFLLRKFFIPDFLPGLVYT